jgi:hypothetical protein
MTRLISKFPLPDSHCSRILISSEMSPQEQWSSSLVLAVSKMVLNRVKEMLVWSSRPSPISGFLVTGSHGINQLKQNKHNKQKNLIT